MIDCVCEDLLHVDEYVSDIKNIYIIISYVESSEIKEIDSDLEDNEFVGEILELNRKYRDWQNSDLDQLDQIESMLAYLE